MAFSGDTFTYTTNLEKKKGETNVKISISFKTFNGIIIDFNFCDVYVHIF